ncbi:MAG: glycosyltransferase family 4 protein [Vicinamibacterales bacterium]
MRILLLTETPPWPLDSGGRIKTHHTLGMLSAEHEVHCHALTRSLDAAIPPEVAARVRTMTLHARRTGPAAEVRALARALRRGWPLTIARHVDGRIAASIRDAARRLRADVVYCDHLSMMEYARAAGGPIVYDAHNVESLLMKRYAAHVPPSARRLLASREWRTLERYERRACLDAAIVLAVSDVDAACLQSLARGRVPVHVVPIAMDVANTPVVVSTPPASNPPAPEASAGPHQLLFVGGLHWPPNADAVVHFVRDVLPLVRRRMPAVELTIVGRTDSSVARAIAPEGGVRLAGAVGDLDPFYASASAVVVPLRSGSGLRVKILEAFARGVPVVSTPIGHEGIDVTPGVELLSADDPAGFADHVVSILTDRRRACAIAETARRFVAAQYDIPVVAARLAAAMRVLA